MKIDVYHLEDELPGNPGIYILEHLSDPAEARYVFVVDEEPDDAGPDCD